MSALTHADNAENSMHAAAPSPTPAAAPACLYVIHCLDDHNCFLEPGAFQPPHGFGGSAKRMSVYAEHKAWQGETSNPQSPHFIHKVAAGPLESECGQFMVGR